MKYIGYLITLLGFGASLHAEETRNIEVSFYCLKYVPGFETIQIAKEGALEAVRLSTANLTAPVTATLTDNHAVIHPGTPGTAAGAPVGKFRVPARINRALVVLIPGPSGSTEAYQSLVIDQGADFRLGSYRVINFSRRSVRGAIGKAYIEAAAGGMTDLELKGDPGSIQGVKFEFEKEGRWNRLTETRCAVRKDRRWLLCIYQDPVTERMNMRSIPDRSNLLVPEVPENTL